MEYLVNTFILVKPASITDIYAHFIVSLILYCLKQNLMLKDVEKLWRMNCYYYN